MKPQNRFILMAPSIVLALVTACATSQPKQAAETVSSEDRIAKSFGWEDDLNRGQKMINVLSGLRPQALAKVEVSAYRGERVAFDGVAAPPGASNDLITANGFYLRVINRARKDLRPQSVAWEVMVRGKILQVLPESRIIVIEVNESDWRIIQTW
jgi:hypothetical protein